MDQHGSDSGEMGTSTITMLRGQWAMGGSPDLFWFSYISVLIDFIPDQERKRFFLVVPLKI